MCSLIGIIKYHRSKNHFRDDSFTNMNLLSFNMIIITVNLALNKPAYQENPFKRSYSIGDASNAVDGQKSNLTRNGGQCVLSAGKETAMLWVNLTSIHSIYNISIYYKTDDKPWGIVFFLYKRCFDKSD